MGETKVYGTQLEPTTLGETISSEVDFTNIDTDQINLVSVEPTDTATLFGDYSGSDSIFHMRIGNGAGDIIRMESWDGASATSLIEIGQSTVTITGNLVVSGTTTTVNSETLDIADNTITLNSGVTGAPSLDAFVIAERGSSTDAKIRWNETDDAWELDAGAGTSTLFVTSGGVGIGTSGPNMSLHIKDDHGYGIADVTAGDHDASDWTSVGSVKITSSNNAMVLFVDGDDNARKAFIQVGHDFVGYSEFLGTLSLNPFGGNVGIGTSSPGALLTVSAEGADCQQYIDTYGADKASKLRLYSARGTEASPEVTQEGDMVGQILFQGHDNARSNTAAIRAVADGEWFTGGDESDSPGSLRFMTTPEGSGAVLDRMTIDNVGNVGIGTESPDYNLEVEGDSALINIKATSAGDSDPTLLLSTGAGIKARILYDESLSQLSLYVGGDHRLVVEDGGNVGIGISSNLNVKLNVAGSYYQTGTEMMFDNADKINFVRNAYWDTNWKRYNADYAEMMQLMDGGYKFKITGTGSADSNITWTDALTIKNDGNIGIGIDDPDVYRLYVSGTARITGSLYVDQDIVHTGDTNTYMRFLSDTISLTTAGWPRFTILADGNVGIGTSPSVRLHVADDVSGYVAAFYNDGNNVDRTGMIIQVGTDDGSGTNYYIAARDGDGTGTGQITVINGVFTFTDTSDERLKQDIKDVTFNGLDTISQIKVRNFKFKKIPDIEQVGFVAQELQMVVPAVVSEDSEGMLGVAKAELVPYLVKAIQELKERIETLESA